MNAILSSQSFIGTIIVLLCSVIMCDAASGYSYFPLTGSGSGDIAVRLHIDYYEEGKEFVEVDRSQSSPEGTIAVLVEASQEKDYSVIDGLYWEGSEERWRDMHRRRLTKPQVIAGLQTATRHFLYRVWYGDMVQVFYVFDRDADEPLMLFDWLVRRDGKWMIVPWVSNLSPASALAALQSRPRDERYTEDDYEGYLRLKCGVDPLDEGHYMVFDQEEYVDPIVIYIAEDRLRDTGFDLRTYAGSDERLRFLRRVFDLYENVTDKTVQLEINKFWACARDREYWGSAWDPYSFGTMQEVRNRHLPVQVAYTTDTEDGLYVWFDDMPWDTGTRQWDKGLIIAELNDSYVLCEREGMDDAALSTLLLDCPALGYAVVDALKQGR